jgi:vancomycin resistance protein YoaR
MQNSKFFPTFRNLKIGILEFNIASMLSYKGKKKIASVLMILNFKKIRGYLFYFLLVLGGLFFLVFCSYELAYKNRIYPGVSLVGYPVGSQTRAEVKKLVDELTENTLRNHPELVLVVNSQEVATISLKELRLVFKSEKSANEAFRFARTKSFWEDTRKKVSAWKKGVALALDFDFDQKHLDQKIASIAAQVYEPAIRPSIEVVPDSSQDALSQVIVSPGQSGQELASRKLRLLLNQKLARLDFAPLELPLLTISPGLSEKEVARTKEEAEKLLGKELVLVWETNEWRLKEKELISFLSFIDGPDQFKIAGYVSQLSESIDQPPRNATFQFRNNRVVKFEPARKGQLLDQLKTTELISNNWPALEEEKEKKITLPVSSTPPAITIADGNDLGIEELIGRGESWFRSSISSRIHNIKTAAAKLNGQLIAPGKTFSFNRALGEVSETTGYKKAYIIKEGRTVLGDGGGVCQVSTTLFRAALNTGLPIVERRAHAYRVSYYEQNSAVGLDATVYDPTTDLKIKNDTSAFILIQTRADLAGRKLTFDLYGASDGRTVTIGKTRIWDQTPPPPALYQEDPSLPVGVTKQIDWPAWGARTAFDWEVKRGEELLQEKTFYSNYKPWQAVYLVGKKP